jgi:hypothetical protein
VTGFADVADVARQDWRDSARCNGAPYDFVDVGADMAEYVVHRYCNRCTVVARCLEEGDRLAPFAWRTVMGARVYGKGERP